MLKALWLMTLLSGANGQLAAEIRSLDGQWDFRYEANGTLSPEAISQSEQGWTKILVPGSFDQAEGNSLTDCGEAYYRTRFATSLNSGQRVFLHFGAVAIRAKVWLNGILVGQHLYPYTSFSFDITSLLRPGSNTLLVLTDNRLLEDAIPDSKATGWWNYGGINRSVFLDMRPAASVANVESVTTMDGSAWKLKLRLSLENSVAQQKASIVVSLTDPQGVQIWSQSIARQLPHGKSDALLSHEFRQIRPWSPSSPNLYRLQLAVHTASGVDRAARKIGFRQIEVRGTSILLNGKPIFLHGVSYHEMYPRRGMSLTDDEIRRDLTDIKHLGSNIVRSQYVLDPRVYDLCDSLGLMTWAELPAWQTAVHTLASESVWENYAKPQLEEMIDQNQTHPSIVLWSIGNEFPSDQPAVAEYVRKAVDFVHGWDPTRLVTYASDRNIRDISFAPVDLIAINEYFGWYYGSPQDLGPLLDRLHRKWPTKPIIVSEFGADAVLGLHQLPVSSFDKGYTEEYQAAIEKSALLQILDRSRSSFMAGAIVWLYADFPWPPFGHTDGSDNPRPPAAQSMNCKGLVDAYRKPKLAYSTVKKIFEAIR